MSMRMIIHRILPLLLATAFLMAGCSRHSAEWQQLEIADAVMEEQPDSALSILTSIDPTSLINQEEKARYALLLTQGMTKNGYIITIDSLINEAVRYYSEKRGSKELMKSLFYKGDIMINMGFLENAMSNLIASQEMAKEFDDYYWEAKTTELIGDIFSTTYNQEEAAKYAKAAAYYYEKAEKLENHRYALVDYATALYNFSEYDRALCLIDSLININSIEEKDSAFLAYCLRVKIPILSDSNKFQEVIDNYEYYRSLNEYYYDQPIIHSLVAQAYLANNKIEEAYRHLEIADSLSCTDVEKGNAYIGWSKFYLYNRDYSKALECLWNTLSLQNDEVKNILNESVVSAQRDYYNSKTQEEKRRNERLSMWLWGIILCAPLVICILFIIYRHRLYVKNAEIDSHIQNILILSSNLSSEKDENRKLYHIIDGHSEEIQKLKRDLEITSNNMNINLEDLKNDFENCLRNSWSALNLLCNEFFEKGDSKEQKIYILNEIDKEVKKIKESQTISEIEFAVNRFTDGLLDRVRTEIPHLKPEEITLISLLIAGFSSRAICFLLDLKYKTFYTKKDRLIMKIKSSTTPIREEVLSKID